MSNKRSCLPIFSPQLDPANSECREGAGRFPSWLHRKMPRLTGLLEMRALLQRKESGRPTVCEEARCPNLLECWSRKTATFLALGKSCTRNCGFCAIDFSKEPPPPEEEEPDKLAQAAKQLGLKHLVITMVARDDLRDGGAGHLVAILQRVREVNPETTIELLTSDFAGNEAALEQVLEARPEIFNHNIETVRALTPRVRHKATYDRTLAILRHASEKSGQQPLFVKSGLMVGLGEQEKEVHETLHDLKEAGCHIITIGQYLQPVRQKLRVKDFISPAQFDAYAEYGRSLGLSYVYAGPFVRSSYNADAVFTGMRKVLSIHE